MNDMKLVKIQAVLERCAVSRATLYRMIEKGSFPRQKSLTGGRAVAWLESEVNEWIASRGPEEVADMFGTNRIARAVYASLTEEERQLEKLALTNSGF